MLSPYAITMSDWTCMCRLEETGCLGFVHYIIGLAKRQRNLEQRILGTPEIPDPPGLQDQYNFIINNQRICFAPKHRQVLKIWEAADIALKASNATYPTAVFLITMWDIECDRVCVEEL